MKVLIVGGGGREHALAWKAAQSPRVEHVYVAPGNAGTGREPKVSNVSCAAEDITGLLQFARTERIALTIVGPEVPLVAGVTDQFNEAGLPCFGPTRAAAILEGSKAYSKAFLKRHAIPTAAYVCFTDHQAAQAYVREQAVPLVIKADGLAAGKGVVIAQSNEEALSAVDDLLAHRRYGEAGNEVVIESFLRGEEASFIVVTDGTQVLPLASSQDHKARDDGDAGPNTGGMGAYSPAPVITDAIHERIMAEVIRPTIRGMAAEGRPYRGFLYAGLMIAEDGTPNVLEFNCRLGDPETQPIILRLKSDLVDLCLAALENRLSQHACEWDTRKALGVVLTAAGYPGAYRKGDVISGCDTATPDDVKVFHAGTSEQDGKLVTAG
jgi:phosphoribosylamine--glycine ligase